MHIFVNVCKESVLYIYFAKRVSITSIRKVNFYGFLIAKVVGIGKRVGTVL